MINILFIFLGAGLGGIVRYLITQYFQNGNISAILICNLLGCFIAGFFVQYFISRHNLSVVYIFIITGFAGGFTTFSAFGIEMINIYEKSGLISASIYISLSVLGGLICTLTGMVISSKI